MTAMPVAGVGSAVGGAILNQVLNAMTQGVVSAASWLLKGTGNLLLTTGPSLGSGWFSSNYQHMVDLGAILLLPLLLGAVIQAIAHQDSRQLVRSTLVYLPLAIFLSGATVELVRLGSSAVDAMSASVATHSGGDLSMLLQDLTMVSSDGLFPVLVVFAVVVILAFGAFALWLELIVRAAAIEVSVLFMPLMLAGLIWPATARLSRRLAETIAALVLSKLVIVAVLALAADAIINPGANAGMGSLLQGTALMFLATLSPFAVLRLLPVIEAGAVGHLEGAGRRLASTVGRPASRGGAMMMGALGGGSEMSEMGLAAAVGPVTSGLGGNVGIFPARDGADRPPLASSLGTGAGGGGSGGGGSGGGGVGGGPGGGGPGGGDPGGGGGGPGGGDPGGGGGGPGGGGGGGRALGGGGPEGGGSGFTPDRALGPASVGAGGGRGLSNGNPGGGAVIDLAGGGREGLGDGEGRDTAGPGMLETAPGGAGGLGSWLGGGAAGSGSDESAPAGTTASPSAKFGGQPWTPGVRVPPGVVDSAPASGWEEHHGVTL